MLTKKFTRRSFLIAAGATACAPGASDSGLDPELDTDPSSATNQDLLYLREEEKLARDVYLTLHERWGLGVFENISASEQRHMDAVLGLLEARGIADPVADDTVGVFTDESLGALYVSLVAAGEVSEVESLLVGATIEDMDIYDLEAMLERNSAADVAEVLGSLLCGSGNHMRAFQGQLADRGVVYEPQYLSAEAIEAILESEQGGCGGEGDGGGNGNGH